MVSHLIYSSLQVVILTLNCLLEMVLGQLSPDKRYEMKNTQSDSATLFQTQEIQLFPNQGPNTGQTPNEPKYGYSLMKASLSSCVSSFQGENQINTRQIKLLH